MSKDKSVITTHVNDRSISIPKAPGHWWKKDHEELFKSVVGLTDQISQSQAEREKNYVKYARLYSNLDILGFAPYEYSRTRGKSFKDEHRLSFNIVESCIDTVSSRLSKNRPRVMFLSSGGDFSLRRRAKQLTKFIEGIFHSSNVYEKGQEAFTNAACLGTGILKVYSQDGEIKVDNIPTNEILVDYADGQYGQPRQIFHQRWMDREVLIGLFPEKQTYIKAVEGYSDPSHPMGSSDLVKVIEAWHLPSGKNAKDGKHCIVIKNTTLFSEEWTKDYFPFAIYRWKKVRGWHGSSLTESLIGIQLEVNRLLRTIQEAHHFIAVPRIFVDRSSQINTKHITNKIGSIIQYSNTPPQIQTGQAMPGEVYSHLENLFRKAYEISGVSQLSASSLKPKGIDSGVALRNLQEIENDRFAVTAQRYENFYIELAELIVKVSKETFGKKTIVKTPSKKNIEKVCWGDCEMNEDDYLIRPYPTNLLPSTPAGKLATVQELVAAGIIATKEEALALLDYPDIERFYNLHTAALDDIERLIEKMIDKGEYQSPEPFMNLDLSLKVTQSAYLDAKNSDVPEERLELLRRFLTDCQDLMAALVSPTPLPVPEGALPPQAVPAPLPQSELMAQDLPKVA